MTGRVRVAATAIVLAASITTGVPAHADPRHWDTASTVGRDALVAVALGLPAVRGDWRGDLEAGGSILLTTGITVGLKELVHERRPDRSDDKSFPSGHASVSFAAAATLEKRYGWRAGVPALLVASFVGVARVQADKHYWHDVIAGAVLGGGTGFLLTSRHDQRVRLLPWAERGGGGLSVAARF